MRASPRRRGKATGIRKLPDGRYQIEARVIINGRRIGRKETAECTLEQAKATREQMKAQIREAYRGGSLTYHVFGEVLQCHWEARQKYSPDYVSRWKKLNADLGNIPLSEFPDRFEHYIRIIRHEPLKKTGELPSRATINRLVEMVRAAFQAAYVRGRVEMNPITSYRFPKLKEYPRNRKLSDIEKHKLLKAIREHRPYLLPITEYALKIPSRKSELVNMRVRQVDLKNDRIWIPHGTTKNERGQFKPILPEMRHYFESIPEGCEYVFYRETGRGYAPLGDFKKAWHHCLNVAGIQDFRFHDTRHCAVAYLREEKGLPDFYIQRLGNWKTARMIEDYHGLDTANACAHAQRFFCKEATKEATAGGIC